MGDADHLKWNSIAVKRHHNHSNSSKGKLLIGVKVQRFSPLSSWKEVWLHTGRHGAREVVKSSISGLVGSRNSK